MQRIEYDRYGGPELMHLATFERPKPGPDEILVQIKAASINPVDWGIRRGKMKFITGSSFPRVMGKDFSGVILEVGAEVADWKAGDEVFGCVPWKRAGSFAPMALVNGAEIVRKPASISFVQAAALPTVGLTAWHGLVQQAKLQPGQRVLVNGAAGGVGSAVVQVAQSLGANITARVGARSFERLKAQGADAILDYRGPLPPELNRRFDIVFDTNGSLKSGDIDRLLKRGGVAVDITVKGPKLLRSLVLRRQKLAFGTVDQPTLNEVARLAADGKLRLGIGAEVSIMEAIPLLERLEGGETLDGKAVIVFG